MQAQGTGWRKRPLAHPTPKRPTGTIGCPWMTRKTINGYFMSSCTGIWKSNHWSLLSCYRIHAKHAPSKLRAPLRSISVTISGPASTTSAQTSRSTNRPVTEHFPSLCPGAIYTLKVVFWQKLYLGLSVYGTLFYSTGNQTWSLEMSVNLMALPPKCG